jgi:hypothetical protein
MLYPWDTGREITVSLFTRDILLRYIHTRYIYNKYKKRNKKIFKIRNSLNLNNVNFNNNKEKRVVVVLVEI